jgi:protein gp37
MIDPREQSDEVRKASHGGFVPWTPQNAVTSAALQPASEKPAMGLGAMDEWTEETWNPVTGCTKVSPGCEHCYAERMSKRLAGRAGYPADEPFRVTLHPERLGQPLRWRKPRLVFVASMGDLFHEDVPNEYIAAVFGVMAAAQRCTFQVLTKRPKRMLEWFGWLDRMTWRVSDMFPDDPLWRRGHVLTAAAVRRGVQHRANAAGIPGGPERRPGVHADIPSWPLPNVWLGVTAEDQLRADERIHLLLQIPAAVHWVSVEPCLGQVYLSECEEEERQGELCFVVVGGETGPGARPMHPDWAMALRDQCQEAGVAFFFKSWGEWSPHGSVALWRNGTRDSINEGLCLMADGRAISRDRPFSEFDERQRLGYGNTMTEDIEPAQSEWRANYENDTWPYNTIRWMYRDGRASAGRKLDGREWNEMPESKR